MLRAEEKQGGGFVGHSRGKASRRGALLLRSAGVTAAFCLLVFLLLCLWVQRSNAVYPNVSLEGIALGGKNKAMAQLALEEHLSGYHESRLVTLYCADEPVYEISYGTLGAEADWTQELQHAYEVWREGAGFFSGGWRYLQALGKPVALRAQLNADPVAAMVAAEEAAEALFVSAEAFAWSAQEDAIAVTVPRRGRQLDVQRLAQSLVEAVAAGEKAVFCDGALHTMPAQILSAEALYRQAAGPVADAGYDSKTDTIIPERIGVDFDLIQAAALLAEAEPGTEIEIPAQVEYPRVLASELEQLLFRDVLGSCTTLVEGTEERKTNVRLSAAAIDGLVLASGEVFDYNAVLGRRTIAKGYREGPAFVGGQTVQTVGGGICQTTSNLYYAAVLANMEILVRSNHGFVCDYIAPGFDAAVSWGGPHFRFRNDSLYPVKIQVSWEEDALTVNLLGSNPDGIWVEFTNEILSTTPYEEQRVPSDTLPVGVEEEKISPYQGHRVKTYRHVYDRTGKLISRTLESTDVYKARDRLVWVGSAPADETAS